MNCKYLSWTFSQFNSRNSLTRIFDLLSNCKQNLMHLFCEAWRCNLAFLRDLKTKLCRHNQKEIESMHYIKVCIKGVLKNGFVYVETSDTNLLYQLCSKPLSHQRDFGVKYTQDILLFRWGTNLCVSLFPSICGFVCLLHTISQETYIIYS